MDAYKAFTATRQLYVKRELRMILKKIKSRIKKGGFFLEVPKLMVETATELEKHGYKLRYREKSEFTDFPDDKGVVVSTVSESKSVITISWANYDKFEEMEYDGTPIRK